MARMPKHPPLATDQLVVGGVYRGKEPQVVRGLYRDEYDDRTILWISADRYSLTYRRVGALPDARPPSMTIVRFLNWASHRVESSVVDLGDKH